MGKAVDKLQATSKMEHFQIKINANGVFHRIAINVKSNTQPSEVKFIMDDDFKHPITDAITAARLNPGFTALQSKRGGIALDFIRGNYFDINAMTPIPDIADGPDNDLNDKFNLYISQAITDTDAVVYAFGQKWGPENGKPDQYFHFEPGNGIHDIHMNQGNPEKPAQYFKDNGIYQDGGIIIHFPSRNKWVALFTAFQSQSIHTDDTTGNPIGGVVPPVTATSMRVIAAMINPVGEEVGKEYVILLNKGNANVDLNNWAIVDKAHGTDTLNGLTIEAGNALKVMLTGHGARLGNNGGTITLLNAQGIKIDGVSYTKDQASAQGVLVEL